MGTERREKEGRQLILPRPNEGRGKGVIFYHLAEKKGRLVAAALGGGVHSLRRERQYRKQRGKGKGGY